MTLFSAIVDEHQTVISNLQGCYAEIEQANQLIQQTFAQGGKILLCGNGGSAADCQHIAAEFVVRYHKVRASLPAIALTTDTSILTAHPNDFSFDTVFARQIEGLGQTGDTLIAISTSGTSENIIQAARVAIDKGLNVITMTGENGGKLAPLASCAIRAPSEVTARIQEAHILIAHWWCESAEAAL